MILHGDSIEVLKTMEECSVDAVVTDPPYGLGDTSPEIVAECLRAWSCGETWTPKGRGGFMGKSWDAWVPPPELWREVLRVMKHGAHALVFAGSRTQDLMSISLRLAGFEVRDTLQWLYGSGFPKSHNVALGIDKLQGYSNRGRAIPTASRYQASDVEQKHKLTSNPVEAYSARSEPAEPWVGWGTALKPAYEPVILIRKPLDGTVANNVLEYGTGAINIDACRVPAGAEVYGRGGTRPQVHGYHGISKGPLIPAQPQSPLGRYPANVILDEEIADLLSDKQRFFYCAKASKTEREAGLEGFEKKSNTELTGRKEGSAGLVMRIKDGSVKANPYAGTSGQEPRANTHPTVKPLDLMRYLCRLITPPNGLILDPFAGSGSTLCAGVSEGFRVLGIEREQEYVETARARLAHWTHGAKSEETKIGDQLNLFAALDKL